MRKLCLVIFLISIPSLCFTEPSKSVHYLMNEPASLFDIGMEKLSNFYYSMEFPELEKENFFIVKFPPYYKWSENRIMIEFVVETPDEYDLKEACKTMINEVKSKLGVTEEGKIRRHGHHIFKFFSHQGYKGATQPENLEDEINKIIVIDVSSMGKDYKTKAVQARSLLLSKDIFFKE